MTDFKAVKREVCPSCSRPTQAYYDARAQHMASAFRSGIPVWQIADAYYVSGPWAMTVIKEQLAKEAVLEIQAAYWQTDEEAPPESMGD